MSEIDPELDATWRTASREQPPAALDDAIRAAARREVGAKPGGFGAAPRWWPLAAAATVAAIAVGIVQMTPPEQVTPGTTTAANDAVQRNVKPDSDTSNANKPQREAPGPAAAPEALRDASKPTAKEQRRGAGEESDRGVLAQTRSNSFAAPPKGEARHSAAAPEALHGANKSTAEEQRLGAGREEDRGELVRQRSENFAAAPGAQFQQEKTLESRQPAPPRRVEGQEAPQRVEEAPVRDQDLKRKTEIAAASSATRPSAAVSNPPASPAARNELQPFPATPAPAESQVSNASPPMAAKEPASAPASVPPPAPAVAAQSSATGALSGNNAGSSAGKIAGNAEAASAQDAAALEKRAPGTADKVTAERRKDTAPLAPDEWIKRIRRLIAEGKNDDAVKELVAFRREYKERAETLLPADLRAFRP
jgi:hypothetical protein